MQGGRAASLCELDALVAVLRATHSLLCTEVCVEPWAQIWSSTDSSGSLTSYKGRTASHTVQVSSSDLHRRTGRRDYQFCSVGMLGLCSHYSQPM